METRTIILFLLGLTISRTFSASIPVHIHLEDKTSSSDVDIPAGEDDALRIKRSGSGSGSPDFFGYIKRGITGKIAQLASASAGASATFSKGSSGGGGGGGGYYYGTTHNDAPISYGSKSFDFWTLKKSILNTLLQAVKAINGGIIAIKGKLIQGGGALITAKGRIISTKGEALVNVGKHIIMNAKLTPAVYPHSEPSGPPVISHSGPSYGPPSNDYGPPSSPSGPGISSPTGGYPDHPPSTYGAPTAAAYGPPIGPSASSIPSHAYLPHKVSGSYDGIVILKKIPKNTSSRGHPHVGLPPSAPSAAALASLPLQDERHKVVKPTVDVTKTPLFSPEAPKTTPFQPTAPSAPTKQSFFESSINPPKLPKPIYGEAIHDPPAANAPSGSAFDAPSGPSAPHAPLLPTVPPVDFADSLSSYGPNSFQFQQPDFNFNKPLSSYNFNDQSFQNPLQNDDNLHLPKGPPPFEINSFGTDLSYGLGAYDNVQTTHSTHFDNLKTDFNSFAPGFRHSGTDLSNFNLKDTILQPGSYPQFDVVKSITYELPVNKRQ